jgi:hypothetical protein
MSVKPINQYQIYMDPPGMVAGEAQKQQHHHEEHDKPE